MGKILLNGNNICMVRLALLVRAQADSRRWYLVETARSGMRERKTMNHQRRTKSNRSDGHDVDPERTLVFGVDDRVTWMADNCRYIMMSPYC